MATTYYSHNFNGDSTGALPSPWSSAGSGVTISVSADTGANTLKFTTTGTGAYGYAWRSDVDTANGMVWLEAQFQFSGTPSSYTDAVLFINLFGNPSGTNPDNPASYQLNVGFYSADQGIVLFANSGSAATALVTVKPAGYGALWTAGTWYRIIFTALDYPNGVGGVFTCLAAGIQRQSDNAWLTSGGTWSNTGVFTAVAAGRLTSRQFAYLRCGQSSVGAYVTNGNNVYCNNVIFQSGPYVNIGSLPTWTPGNSAELQGTWTVSDTGTGSAANLHDGNLTTGWKSTATSEGWAQLDLGSGNSAVPTRVWIATDTAYSTNAGGNEVLAPRTLIEGASSSSGPWTSLGTVPEEHLLGSNYLPIPLAGSTAFRYLRLRNPYTYVDFTEIRFEGQMSGSPSWQPVAPTLSPAAGKFANGSTVTMTCPTSGASIYYTTDGSTPTTGSTLYSGPVTLPSSAVTTVKAIAYHASGTTTTSRVTTGIYTCPLEIIADTGSVWPGTSFNTPENVYEDRGTILAEDHFGAITYDSSTGKYLWVGQNFNTINDSSGNPQQDLSPVYSSTDLYNWHLEIAVPNSPSGYSSPDNVWLGAYSARPFLLINPSPINANNKYLLSMWNYDGGSFLTRWSMASSPSLGGPWVWHILTDVNIKMQSGFVDPNNGNAYAVGATAHANTNLQAYQLDPTQDWLATTGSAITLDSTGLYEQPIVFYHGGYYFLVASNIMPYGTGNSGLVYKSAAGSSLSAVASTLNSASWTSIWSSPPGTATVAYNAQCAFITAIQGRQGFVLGVDSQDRESPIVQYDSRATMFPLPWSALSAGTLSITPPTPPWTWSLSSIPAIAGGLFRAATLSLGAGGPFFQSPANG